MKARAARSASITDLVDAYRKAAADHGSASLAGDYKIGNKCAYAVAVIYRELRRRGPEAQGALLVLIEHEDASVRAWAAAHALEFAPHKGIPVLEAIARSEASPLNFSAEMTLEVWERGELKFP